jgi:spore germination protein PA
MPAIVGAVNVNSITGVFNIGDVRTISPKSYSKTFAGGGSFNSGTNLYINNKRSVIHVHESGRDEWPVFVQDVGDSEDKGRDYP